MTVSLPNVPWLAVVLIALLLGGEPLARPETPANTTVTGTVVDSGDRPVAEATVEARHWWFGTRKVTTDRPCTHGREARDWTTGRTRIVAGEQAPR
jgi:hypothetical protein